MEKLHMRMRISIELARSCQSTETSVKKTYKKYILKNHHFRLPSSKMRQLQSRRDIFNSNYNNVFRSCKYMRFILLYWVGFFFIGLYIKYHCFVKITELHTCCDTKNTCGVAKDTVFEIYFFYNCWISRNYDNNARLLCRLRSGLRRSSSNSKSWVGRRCYFLLFNKPLLTRSFGHRIMVKHVTPIQRVSATKANRKYRKCCSFHST